MTDGVDTGVHVGEPNASTPTLLVSGTASHVGKSTIVTGLCRLLADRGISVAPFKAQNMSNNAHVAVTPDGDWGEIGVSQYVQSRAASRLPSTDVNPVLLKPRGDGESQLVLSGTAVETVESDQYYTASWERATSTARAAYTRLASDHDIVVAEGAGSIAEINLQDRDLANVETARFADAAIVLVADIDRGGAFASLYGTLELVPPDLRDRVVGVVINKFRGDRSILEPGIEEIEARTGVPVIGVLPHRDPGLPAEDSVSLPSGSDRATVGADSGIPEDETVTIGVPRLPHLSNATDLDPLARVPGVEISIRPPGDPVSDLDAVIIPGTKNTVDDLLTLRSAGFHAEIEKFDGPIVGICGGYQMLGKRIENADREGTADRSRVEGFGLLPVLTRFEGEKRVCRTTVTVEGTGPIDGASGRASGYEIHVGETTNPASLPRPLGPQSVGTDSILGTYLHGLFENRSVRRAFVETVYRRAGRPEPYRNDGLGPAAERGVEEAIDAAAALVSRIDWSVVPGLPPIAERQFPPEHLER
ncbi:MAG: cobyric acid synthase [Halodesulfurarchaeum sp.]